MYTSLWIQILPQQGLAIIYDITTPNHCQVVFEEGTAGSSTPWLCGSIWIHTDIYIYDMYMYVDVDVD